jgi:heme-degrading monooxygenase HmoA
MPESAQYAVVFVSERTDDDLDGYSAMAERMEELARVQPGFVDVHTVRDATGKGVSVSYWSSLKAIRDWASHAEHLVAQRLGRERWYRSFRLDLVKIERTRNFEACPTIPTAANEWTADHRVQP